MSASEYLFQFSTLDLFSKFVSYTQILSSPRSKITGRFRQESTGNRWNVEVVFPPENFRLFPDDFRPVPAGKHRKLTRIHRKKSNEFPVGILLPLPAISGAFLQDPAGSGGRNHRPGGSNTDNQLISIKKQINIFFILYQRTKT
jgi:hypothetical protein